jgi:4-hydroxybenzoate polyprenyltransferase
VISLERPLESRAVSADDSLARPADPIGDIPPPPAPSRLSTLARALRLHQWVKNFLLFMPLAMTPTTNADDVVAASIAFAAFGLCASAMYVVNDLLDREADRRHAVKRDRPFAAGQLSVGIGLVLAASSLTLGLALASVLPPAFAAVLFTYTIVSAAYSIWLKHVPLVDVILLAMLYTGRVIAGGAATDIVPSPWLLGFSLFFFLSLAFVKRYSELYVLRRDRSSLKVRGYYPADLEMITMNGTVSGYLAVLVAALYINGDRASGIYHHPELLWLICPLLLYWISRIWMLAHRGQLDDDPLLFAIRDPASYAVGGMIVAVLLMARL